MFSRWRLLFLAAFILGISPVGRAQETVEAYKVSVLAGRSSLPVSRDGIGEQASFESITAMWGDGANLYVADGIAIRRIELNTSRVTTLSRTAATGLHRSGRNSGFSYDYSGLYGLWGDGDSLYGTDIGDGSVRKIDLQTGGVQTLAKDLGLAWGLAGRESNLYVASAQSGSVIHVDSRTGYSSSLGAGTGSGTPYQCGLGSGCIGYFVPSPRNMWTDRIFT